MNLPPSKPYSFHPPRMYAIRACHGKYGKHLGWQVVLIRNGKTYEKHFANSRHGGRAPALAAAKAWRDEVSRSVPCITRAALTQMMRQHNTSGYPGVYLMATTRKTANGVRKHWMWQARTPRTIEPARTKSFAVQRYGYEGAYAKAVAARDEFVRELAGQQWMRVIPKALRPVEDTGAA